MSTEDAGRTADRGEQREVMTPGDEAPLGDPAAGENLCRVCNGTGDVDGERCEACGGSGKVASGVGGA